MLGDHGHIRLLRITVVLTISPIPLQESRRNESFPRKPYQTRRTVSLISVAPLVNQFAQHPAAARHIRHAFACLDSAKQYQFPLNRNSAKSLLHLQAPLRRLSPFYPCLTFGVHSTGLSRASTPLSGHTA